MHDEHNNFELKAHDQNELLKIVRLEVKKNI